MKRIISNTRNSIIILNSGIIHKELKEHTFWNELSMFERDWTFKLLKEFPVFQIKEYTTKLERLIRKEVDTYKIWQQVRIQCPEVINFNNKSIKMSYIEGDTCVNLFENSKEIDYNLLEQIINKYQRIRNCALKRKDSLIFHSDPQLTNFIYDYKNEIISIDSGNLLNNNLSLNTLDSRLSLFFIYSIFNLKQSTENKIDIISKIINSFNGEEKENLLSENLILKNYRATLPQNIKYKFSIPNYSKANINLIHKILN